MKGESNRKLHNLLGRPELAALRQRLRERFSRLAADESPPFIRLARLLPAEYEALAMMTGRPASGAQSIVLDVAAVDAALNAAGVANSLKEALEELDGPIAAAVTKSEREAEWTALRNRCEDPRIARLFDSTGSIGLLKRLAKADLHAAGRLLQHASAVLSRLPAKGVPRSQLAADVLGDAHALDNGQPIATLVLAVYRRTQSIEEIAESGIDGSTERLSESVREVWAKAGVVVNELARPALILNVPVQSENLFCDEGEPVYLSLRRLLRRAPTWDVRGRDVYVCENPNVVAIAADQLGGACAPLVCTDGMPAAAQRVLLDQLVASGAQLLYHGDFDWAGIGIASHVIRNWAAKPWRYGRAEYEAAVSKVPHAEGNLTGLSVTALWDPLLTESMERHRIGIAEEAVSGELLADLDRRLR
ncbi:TIGR02679 family protein [Paraburkholderia edwinii]|uniref:TIGR02679 family protein n=1 Tax=Paraburkholderia edwinii TaxID=2861782 RepID=A0ABX8UJ49_9BURK|nr:TIGR02679 family protein [Paraburkholderia edwinii]QYD69032.1 TIGR02679 family protein [Paraburkholderia edwinii]